MTERFWDWRREEMDCLTRSVCYCHYEQPTVPSHIDAPLRQTEALFNEWSLQPSGCVLKFEQDSVWSQHSGNIHWSEDNGWNVKSKAWKYWPTPNWGQISKLIHQRDVTEDDPQLSAVSPHNVTSNLYFYFSWGTCRNNHWIYIHLHCKQYVNQKKKHCFG